MPAWELQDEERYERIDGEIVMMAPASRWHNTVGANLYHIIRSYLRGKRCRVFLDTFTRLDEENLLAPDVAVVCDPSKIRRDVIDGAPDFIAEILSPSTRANDIGRKKRIYEKYGVKEYWVINPKEETIDAYLLRDGRYVLEASCHNYTKEEWDLLPEDVQKRQTLSLKLSLYDDLEIDAKDVFEDV